LVSYKLGKTNFKISTGFNTGFLIHSSHNWTGELTVLNSQGNNIAPGFVVDNAVNEIHENVVFTKINLSVTIGFAYELKSIPLGFDFRSTYGLNNINKNTTEKHSSYMKNRGLQFSLYYSLLK